MNTSTVIQHTKNWLRTVIIAHTLCPFAKREYERGSIHYSVLDTSSTETCLTAVIEACNYLDSHPECETTLLILTQGFNDFETYLDLLDLAEALLQQQGYEGHLQLASFHPDYRFADAPNDDPANYTNRSPYPMLHLLREASIEAVLKTYPDPENIPERNIQHTRQLGITTMQKLLASCFTAPSE